MLLASRDLFGGVFVFSCFLFWCLVVDSSFSFCLSGVSVFSCCFLVLLFSRDACSLLVLLFFRDSFLVCLFFV